MCVCVSLPLLPSSHLPVKDPVPRPPVLLLSLLHRLALLLLQGVKSGLRDEGEKQVRTNNEMTGSETTRRGQPDLLLGAVVPLQNHFPVVDLLGLVLVHLILEALLRSSEEERER